MKDFDYYRERFKILAPYIKFNSICKDLGISQPNFSNFMREIEGYLSLKTLARIDNYLQEHLVELLMGESKEDEYEN